MDMVNYDDSIGSIFWPLNLKWLDKQIQNRIKMSKNFYKTRKEYSGTKCNRLFANNETAHFQYFFNKIVYMISKSISPKNILLILKLIHHIQK